MLQGDIADDGNVYLVLPEKAIHLSESAEAGEQEWKFHNQ
jgi:hypothetical protein